MRFTDTKGGKAGAADVNIFQARASSYSNDGFGVAKVSTVNLSSPSTEVTLQAGQYFATWGDQTLNFQVGAQMDQQIILSDSLGGSGLDLLPAGLSFPGKGTVLMFSKILTNANETLSLALEEAAPARPQPTFVFAALGLFVISMTAVAAILLVKRARKGKAAAAAVEPAPVATSSPKNVQKGRKIKVADRKLVDSKSPDAAGNATDNDGHFEERSKDYKNP